jgi:16S rRNA (cytidine1402-2'-O)-methyltransferase
MADQKKQGVLYVVATPIGNLADISHRALRILKEACLVACEDTRQTRKLLDHYGITTSTISYHEHNEAARAEELVAKLEAGGDVVQVSDAGMPGISDPGYRVIKLAIDRGIQVVPVPGASALIAALVGSGLPTDVFTFYGFLPSKSGQRRTALESFGGVAHTIVVYEAPNRIRETLEDVVMTMGADRPVVVARELTKIHEEFIRGSAAEVLSRLQGRELRGEITLLIGPGKPQTRATESQDLAARLQQIMQEQKIDEKAALKILAKEKGLAKSAVYRELQRTRGKSQR